MRRHGPSVRMLHEFRQQIGVSGLRQINQHLLERLLRRQGVQPHTVALMDATDLPAACSGFKKKHRHIHRHARGFGRTHAQDQPEPLVRRVQEAHPALVAADGASVGDLGAVGQLVDTGQCGRGRFVGAQPALVSAATGLVAGRGGGGHGLSGGRKQEGRAGKLADRRGDPATCGYETLAALCHSGASRMSARPAAGMVGVRTGNGATMVSRGGPTQPVRRMLGSGDLPPTLRLSRRATRDLVWLAAVGQPAGSTIVAAGPSVGRTGAVLREKPTGTGPAVLQQPAIGLADEFVGRQRGTVAHDGVVGHADGGALAPATGSPPDGTRTERWKITLREKVRFSPENRKITK